MLAVLSPAKKLDFSPASASVHPTTPSLMKDAESLMRTTRGLSQTKIRELMHLSADLAKLNYDRYHSFELPFGPDNAMPAALAFNGDVYRGLDARSLSATDLGWAQDKVMILSGMFGLLRPLDLIQPYRLEMGTKLATRRGRDLYQFWGSRIRELIDATLEGHPDPSLINLASNEYFKAVQAKQLNRRTITCVFEDYKQRPDEGKVISFLAKIARGTMARYIITERLDRAEGLKDFALDRYRFDAARSTDTRWIFSRKFIPVAK
ncbi:peroxide stress protein YaaA [Enhygromyxa salina]|nr:peroxide stress protein YaaA [Enhygromyxa salina]